MDYFDNTWDGMGQFPEDVLYPGLETVYDPVLAEEIRKEERAYAASPPRASVEVDSVLPYVEPPGGVAVIGTGIGPGVRRAQIGPGVQTLAVVQTLAGLAVGLGTWWLTGRPVVGAVVGAGTGYLVGRAGRA